MSAFPTEQAINTEAEKCDVCRHVWKEERPKKKKKYIYTIPMLTSLMYKLGEHASVAHVHTRTHVASMLLLALRGETEHLRPIRPPWAIE